MDKLEEITEFFDSFCEHEGQRLKQRVLWEDVGKAEAELDAIRENNASLNKHLKNNIEDNNFSISTKYVNLKERHDAVLDKIEDLKTALETLKINTAKVKEKTALESEEKIKREDELGSKRSAELKSKIDNRKLEHEFKVEKLYNELELARAAAFLEQDDIETTLLRELMDMNKKIWRQQNGNTDLQIEIDDLNRRQQATATPVSNPDNSLRFFHLDNFDDLFNDFSKNDDGNAKNDTIAATSKYQPLPIIRKRKPDENEQKNGAKVEMADHIKRSSSGQRQKGRKLRSILKQPDNPANSHEANKKSVTFAPDNVTSLGGSNKSVEDNQSKNALERKTENGNTVNTKPPKKRKLFNLDDLGYLDHMKMNSDDSDG